jgi:hypothetical protein
MVDVENGNGGGCGCVAGAGVGVVWGLGCVGVFRGVCPGVAVWLGLCGCVVGVGGV